MSPLEGILRLRSGRLRVVLIFFSALVLSACSSRTAGGEAELVPARPTRTPPPTATLPVPSPTPADLTRTDSQGAVEFVVEPVNLQAEGETLDFTVSMNTHSVDVGWDLAALSSLETDTGRTVGGLAWPIGGGHHYGGTLSFPLLTAEGEALLEGAATLRLTIRDTDVPERVFTWQLPG